MVDVGTGSSASSVAPERIETKGDMGKGDAGEFAYWDAQEAIAEKEEQKWVKSGREIVRRYRDERPDGIDGNSRFNILWSNVQTLLPVLFGKTPKPDVQRRWNDQDDTGRLSSLLLERSIAYFADHCAFENPMKAAVQDRLLPGRGVVRVLYVPHFGDPIEEDEPEGHGEGYEETAGEGDEGVNKQPVNAAGDEGLGKNDGEEPPREVVFEEARWGYVFWEDYSESPARTWEEVYWVRYRSYLTRDELVDRFGRNKGKQVNLDYTPKGAYHLSKKDLPPDLYKKAMIHEVWDKNRKKVIWYAPGTPDLILDTVDDPLGLPGFFPNPDPLLATTTNDKRIPVADYTEYKDQATQLDTLTARIDRLLRALKVSGVYPGDEKATLQQLVDEGTENRLIPVEEWATWTDKGGLSQFIQWFPIKEIAETLIQLYDARDRQKALLYEITGLSDILRGQTVPDETLGAQELKANFATRRITPQQREVARFARDLFRLAGALIANHFEAKTISIITGYPQLAPVPQLPPMPKPPPEVIAWTAGVMRAQQHGQQLLAATGSPEPSAGGAPPSGQPPAPQGDQLPMPQPPPKVAQFYQQVMQWKQAQAQVQQVQQANQQKQQQFDEAVQLIKQDGEFGFRIDIETDSTIAPDEQAEKQARTEFVGMLVPFMEKAVPFAQGNPALADFIKEITLFAARGFKIARSFEETIEKAFAALAQMPMNPKATGQEGGVNPHGADPAELQARAADRASDEKIAAQEDETKRYVADQDVKIEAMRAGGEHAKDVADHDISLREQENKKQIEREKLAVTSAGQLASTTVAREGNADKREERRQKQSDKKKEK